jgi:hypothetical protein
MSSTVASLLINEVILSRHMSFASPVQASIGIPLSIWNEKLRIESSKITVRFRSSPKQLRSLTRKLQMLVQCFLLNTAWIY